MATLPALLLSVSALAQGTAPTPAVPASWPAPTTTAATGLQCSRQAKPEMPRAALQQGISGEVRAVALVRDGVVVDVHIQSGPAIYHATVKRALMQYQCSGQGIAYATQVFNFQLDASPGLPQLCPTRPLPEVQARIVVGAGKVQEVKFLSGPVEFQAAVRNALNAYTCRTASPEVFYPLFSFAGPATAPVATVENPLAVVADADSAFGSPAAPDMGKPQRALFCRVQVRPRVPDEAYAKGISGVVKAQATVVNGNVVDVLIISGPNVFHQPVKDALMQYKCQQVPETVRALQTFNFNLSPTRPPAPTLYDLAGPPLPAPVDEYALQGATCKQQAKPRMPVEAARSGRGGNVKAQARIADGVVKDVTILSGDPLFHSAVKDAMLGYSACEAAPGAAPATQSFHFQPSDDDILEAICPTRPAPQPPAGLAANQFPAEVRVRMVVTRGKVQDVRFMSGPEAFHGAVSAALARYGCDEDAKSQVVYRSFRFAAP